MGSFEIRSKVRKAIIGLLRESFTSNPYYIYTSNSQTTGIGIYSTFPKALLPYPVIVVEISGSEGIPRCFGDDIFYDVYGSRTFGSNTIYGGCYQIFGGAFNLSVSIKVHAPTLPERENILDWALTYLRHENKSYFENQAIDFINISTPAEEVQIYGADLVYISSVEIGMFAEWERIVLETDDILEDYELDVELLLGDDGLTTGDDTTYEEVELMSYLPSYYESVVVVDEVWGKHVFEHTNSLRKLSVDARNAPTGADLVIALLKNGVETGETITLPAGDTFAIYTVPTPIEYVTDDYLEYKFTQVGSDFPGQGIEVTAYYVQET